MAVEDVGIFVVTIISPRMVARHGFISRIADVFDRHGVSIDMISTSEVSVSLTTDTNPIEQPELLSE
ncbi:MAG: ACT domain-containing protein, partial [Planctomycetota bacterium]